MKRFFALLLIIITLMLVFCKDKEITTTSSSLISSYTVSSNVVNINSSVNSSNFVVSSNLISSKQNNIVSSSNISSVQPISKIDEKPFVSFVIKNHLKTVFEGEVEITDGDSVFAVLEKVCKDNNIQLSSSKTFGLAYVSSIDNLAEKAVNAQSGWIYKVNGVKPSVGCSSYKLKNGDKVEWLYTLNLE